MTNPSIGYPDSLLLTEGSQASGLANHHQYQPERDQFPRHAPTASELDGYDHMPKLAHSPPPGPRENSHLPPPPAFYTPEEESTQMANLPRGYSQSQESDDFWNPMENLNYRGHMSNQEPLSQTTSIHSAITVSSNEGSLSRFSANSPEPPERSNSGSRSGSMQSSEGRFEPAGVVLGGHSSSGHSRQSSMHSRNQLPPLQEDTIMEEERMEGARTIGGRFQFHSKLSSMPPQQSRSLDHMLDGGRRGRDMELQQHYLPRRVRHEQDYPVRTEAEHGLSSHRSVPVHQRHGMEHGHQQTVPRMNGYPEDNTVNPYSVGRRQSPTNAYPQTAIDQNYPPPPPLPHTRTYHHTTTAQGPPQNYPSQHQRDVPAQRAMSLQNVPGYGGQREPQSMPMQGQSLSQGLEWHQPPIGSQIPHDRHTSLQHLDRNREGGHYMNPNPNLPPGKQRAHSRHLANGPSVHHPNHRSLGELAHHSKFQEPTWQQQRARENQMPDVVRHSTSPQAQDLRSKPTATRLEDLGHISDMHSRKPQLKKGKVPGQVWVQEPMTRAIESSSESDGETATVLSQSDMGDNHSLNSMHV